MRQALRNTLIAMASTALIAACSGSNDGATVGGGGAANPATITTANAPAVAGVVAEAALGQGIFTSIFSPGIPIASSGAGTAVAPLLKPVLSAAMEKAGPSQLYATSAGQTDCAVSGTVDIQIDIADPMAPSVNDTFILEFTNCDDGTGAVVNGGMTMTITAVSGDPATGNFLLGMRIEFAAFAVTEGGETTAASGSVNIEIDTSNPPITTISVSTSALVTTSAGTEEVLTSFTAAITEDASTFPVAVTVETAFTLSSPRIGGAVTVTTSLSLQSMGEEYPYMGELRISGADGAVIVMIALDANTVRLQIDLDGDGGPDDTLDLTWDELMAAAG